MHYYAAGYYEAAKRQRSERVALAGIDNCGNPAPAPAIASRNEPGKSPTDAHAQQVPAR
jgi:hypothetical protein